MKRNSVIAFVSCAIIATIFIGTYVWDNTRVKKIASDDVVESLDNNIAMNIENVDIGEKNIKIEGWALEKDKMYDYVNWTSGPAKSVYNNNEIILEDEDGNLFKVNTVSKKRPDINESMGNKVDYKNCGVEALISKSKLNKKSTYKIGIKLTTLSGRKIISMSDKEITI